VMAAIKLHEGETFNPAGFAAFLEAQSDLGTKWSPRYIRISKALPSTQTNKVLKRVLAREGWECSDPVWVRHGRGADYELLTDQGRAELRKAFAGNGREHLLAAPVAP
jgi:fatty-acyl-CoA synthase